MIGVLLFVLHTSASASTPPSEGAPASAAVENRWVGTGCTTPGGSAGIVGSGLFLVLALMASSLGGASEPPRGGGGGGGGSD